MTLKLGSRTAVVISSPDIAKEALKTNDQVFSSRTIPDTSRTFNHHKFSVAWLPASTQWRKLRKVSATQIFAPQRLDATQALRRVKVQQLLDHVQACCSSGRAVDIGRAVFTTGLNAYQTPFSPLTWPTIVRIRAMSFRKLYGVPWKKLEGLTFQTFSRYFVLLIHKVHAGG
ncbi:Cytochrome P450 76C2 [Morella rubra]|uniref:Cytochrome P450 76C2 n=1 Tax=Morella rubra TaxID=262757 RepID=A0A6A1W119_9ROSI|nr:Cytochrome P450 76C2 [Morella rubra]